jgi:hypothetical protein
MSWKFVKAKFKVGETVRFPYGRKIGKIKAVGLQVYEGKILGLLYKIMSYDLTETQLKKYRKSSKAC